MLLPFNGGKISIENKVDLLCLSFSVSFIKIDKPQRYKLSFKAKTLKPDGHLEDKCARGLY